MLRMFRIGRLGRIPVFAHWSVLAIVGAFLAVSLGSLAIGLAAAGSYFGLILLHESGHAIAAARVRCPVFRIDLFPLHGRCVVDEPYDEIDHIKISWGGVLAQLVVALPLVVFGVVHGLTEVQAVNSVVAILGFFSLFMVVLNLIPVFRMDGETAWRILPFLAQGVRSRLRSKRRRRKLKVIRPDRT